MRGNCVKYVIISLLLLIPVAGFTQLVNNPTTVRLQQGRTITLTASSNDVQHFQWFRNGNIIQGATEKRYTVRQPGRYTVISFNNVNCSSDVSLPVDVFISNDPDPGTNPPVTANLMISKKAENKPVLVNDELSYTITVSNQGPDDASGIIIKDNLPNQLSFKEIPHKNQVKSSYHTQSHTAIWEIHSLKANEKIDVQLITKVTAPGAIKNNASVTANEHDPDENNNSDSVIKNVYGIKIPNVFTPNNDGLNDVFNISGLDAYPENEITIINRWGNHVYERSPYQNDWTGDGLNDGTYFYVLKIKSAEGQWEVFKGFITLLKNKR